MSPSFQVQYYCACLYILRPIVGISWTLISSLENSVEASRNSFKAHLQKSGRVVGTYHKYDEEEEDLYLKVGQAHPYVAFASDITKVRWLPYTSCLTKDVLTCKMEPIKIVLLKISIHQVLGSCILDPSMIHPLILVVSSMDVSSRMFHPPIFH